MGDGSWIIWLGLMIELIGLLKALTSSGSVSSDTSPFYTQIPIGTYVLGIFYDYNVLIRIYWLVRIFDLESNCGLELGMINGSFDYCCDC